MCEPPAVMVAASGAIVIGAIAGAVTDSAGDIADSVDTAVRAVSFAITRPVQLIAGFAAGVFASESDGLDWAARHRVSGLLTEYAVGVGSYDLAVREGRFRPSRPHHGTPAHVAAFSSHLRHLHIVDGHPA